MANQANENRIAPEDQLEFKQLDPGQLEASRFIVENPYAGLWLPMGAGKTVTVGTALDALDLQDQILVIAPPQVCMSTWPDEFMKWKHLQHLTYSIVLGTPKQRIQALLEDTQFKFVSVYGVEWITQMKWRFPTVIWDESGFVRRRNKKFKAMYPILRDPKKVNRLVLMTGTPAPNSYENLWPQIYLLDGGRALEENISKYRSRYFDRVPNVDYNSYRLRSDVSANQIKDKLIDSKLIYAVEHDQTKLPGMRQNKIMIDLPVKVMQEYRRVASERVFSYIDPETGEFNSKSFGGSGPMLSHLMQRTSGAYYVDDMDAWREMGDPDLDIPKKVIPLHEEKLSALKGIMDGLQGNPLLIGYCFRHEREAISRIKHVEVFATHSEKQQRDQILRFKRGEIAALAAHPASIGHGLNLQDNAHNLLWYTTTLDNELHQQMNFRLNRRGQKNEVNIHYLICRGTVDESVFRALQKKEKSQQWLLRELIRDTEIRMRQAA
jgi:hypothetical protein